jgi:hypothetical protein
MKDFFLNNRIIGIFILSILSFSCSSDLDFNQVQNLKLTPVVVSNLAIFELPANEFVTGGIEKPVAFDVPNFDVFKDAFFKDNLRKAEFFFEINNTINREYTINLTLLDINDTPLYNIAIPVPAYTGVENIVTKTEIFDNNVSILTNTRKMAFAIFMKPGSALSENSLGSLKLRSSATAYFTIE